MLVHERLKIGPLLYPPSVDSAFYFIARLADEGQQTEVNETVPNGGQEIALITCSKKLGSFLPRNWGPKTVYIWSFYDDFETSWQSWQISSE